MDRLVERARGRWIANLALEQAVLGACGSMLGLVLLLVAGTQILDWWWIAALAAIALGFGGVRLIRRIPSRYSVAQAIDARLALQDSISTAFFYRHQSRRRTSEDLRAAQLAAAESMAAKVPVRQAVPFAAPRSLYAMAALVLVASSLLALRYGVSHRLDLKRPLASIVLDVFNSGVQPEPVAKNTARDERTAELASQLGLSLQDDPPRTGSRQAPPSLAGQSDEAQADSRADLRGAPSGEKTPGRQPSEAEGGPEDETAGLSLHQDGDGQGSKGDRRSASLQPANGRRQAGSQQANNGLLDKFRDALSSLMSRLKSQPRGADSQQAANSQAGRSEQAENRPGQQGSPQSGRDAQGLPGSEGPGEEQSEGAQQAQAGQAKQGGGESEQASDEGHSGIGKEDGNKSVREAEQLAAMGKISEILGKRSQTLTGDMMVEVESGAQQLRTPYSRQSAAHADTGGEIHRDEVPLAYQRYVQQYFEQIRKVPPVKP